MPPRPKLFDRIVFYGDFILPLSFWKNFIFFGSLVLASYLTLTYNPVTSAKLAIIILTIVIFTKPFVKLFPTFGIFKTLLALRRQTGEASALFAIAHVLNQFGLSNIFQILNFYFLLGPADYRFWGIPAILLMLLLFVTSNDLSTRLLKRNWFRLHLLIHPLYVFALIHYSLYKGRSAFVLTVFALIVLYGLRLLANRNVRLLTNFKPAPLVVEPPSPVT